jgi:TolB protein
MVLTVGLMIVSPALAVKGSYPGKNGKIAFSASVEGVEQIWVMNPDGTDRQQLTHGELDSKDPTWSPDGTEIAYTYGTGIIDNIWVMNADGSNPHALTSGVTDRNPAWSPDGAKIAFARKGVGGGIYIMNADGTGTPTPLTTNGQDYDPAWSPDGTKIAFVRSGQVWVLTVGGSASQLLTKSSTHPCWSPDGSKIVYDSTVSEIWVVDADGNNDHSTGVTGGSPNWSPDGTKIAFDLTFASIHVMNADGSGAADLTPTMPDAESPDWQRLPQPSAPVGGNVQPVNAFAALAPWLAVIGLVGCIGTVFVVAKKRRQ